MVPSGIVAISAFIFFNPDCLDGERAGLRWFMKALHGLLNCAGQQVAVVANHLGGSLINIIS